MKKISISAIISDSAPKSGLFTIGQVFDIVVNALNTLICSFASTTLRNWVDSNIDMVTYPKGANNQDPSIAAIQFAIDTDGGLEFLRAWNEGNFDACRREWPDCPPACFVGADPLLRNPQCVITVTSSAVCSNGTKGCDVAHTIADSFIDGRDELKT